MRDFELDRPVDAVAVTATNAPAPGGAEPLAVKVPFIAIPIIVWAHAAVVQQVALGLTWVYRLAVVPLPRG